jgi:hypothetical protein
MGVARGDARSGGPFAGLFAFALFFASGFAASRDLGDIFSCHIRPFARGDSPATYFIFYGPLAPLLRHPLR